MPRILVVTHAPPLPPTNGGHQRSNLLLRALRACGDVDLILLPRSTKRYSEEELAELRRDGNLLAFLEPHPRGARWPWSLVRPLSPSFIDSRAMRLGRVGIDYVADRGIKSWLDRRFQEKQYDLIVGRYLQPTAQSGALLYEPVIVDVDDVDSDRWRTELSMPGLSAFRRRLLAQRVRDLDQLIPGCLAQANHLWVCSESDRQWVGVDRAGILPNIPFEPQAGHPIEPAPPCGGARVLMVGNLKYSVNERAIHRFLKHCWPIIRKTHPEAQFRIVGAGMSALQRARWARYDGVVPIGFAEDLGEEYARAAFTVAPLFEGGGTKIKVLESLAYARTCVVAKHSLRGFDHVLRHGDSVWAGDNDEEITEGCCTLLADPARCSVMAEKGRDAVVKHFSFQRFQSVVSETVHRVLEEYAGKSGVREKCREASP